MRKTTFAICLVIVGAVCVFGQAETEWIKFSPPEKYFSLSLPGEPKLEVVGDTLKHNRYSRYGQGYGFVIEYFENIKAGNPEEYLDGTRDGIVSALKGTFTGEKKISLDGLPGRELGFTITAENGTEVLSRVRIYYGDGKLYSMSYVWRKDLDSTLASQIGEKYFSSIKIGSK